MQKSSVGINIAGLADICTKVTLQHIQMAFVISTLVQGIKVQNQDLEDEIKISTTDSVSKRVQREQVEIIRVSLEILEELVGTRPHCFKT